jgi:hypothetical protein
VGRISKCGDGFLRTCLYKAAAVLLTKVKRWSPLKAWGVQLMRRILPIHEIGHYVGLDHDPHDSAGEIMWKPSQPADWGASVLNHLVTTGEANFTLDDVDRVWSWITTNTAVRDRFLP